MRYLLSFLLLVSANLWGAELQIPTLTSPVMDLGGFLNEADKKSLADLAYEIHTNNGPQITILTVPDMQDYPIEEFSIRVAEKWQLGSAEKDNGLLVVIAKAERQMRIEVGNGIEGEITDYDTSRYTRDIFPKYFKRGEFYGGLRVFMEDVAKRFDVKITDSGRKIIRPSSRALPRINLAAILGIIALLVIVGSIFKKKPGARSFSSGVSIGVVGLLLGLPIAMIVIMFIFGGIIGLIGIGNVLTALAYGSMVGGHRGGGGFGGGGGGWGGGGGGFSGGGSSGSW